MGGRGCLFLRLRTKTRFNMQLLPRGAKLGNSAATQRVCRCDTSVCGWRPNFFLVLWSVFLDRTDCVLVTCHHTLVTKHPKSHTACMTHAEPQSGSKPLICPTVSLITHAASVPFAQPSHHDSSGGGGGGGGGGGVARVLRAGSGRCAWWDIVGQNKTSC